MIALGCDHGGFELMQEVMAHLEREASNTRISVPTPRNPVIIRNLQRR